MPANPTSISTQLQEAVAHHRAGRLSDAEKLYRRVLQAAPDEPNALRLMAGIALQSGRHSMAETLLRRGLATRPDSAELHRLLAAALLERNRAAAAATSAGRALELDPAMASARLLLGNALHAGGDLAGAEREWRTVLTQEPGNVATQYNLAQLLLKDGRNGEARSILEAAVAKAPSHGGALALLGEATIAEDPRAATALLRRAMAAGENGVATVVALAAALSKQKDHPGALALLQEAARREPRNMRVLNDLTQALLRFDRTDEALAIARQALKSDATNDEAHNNVYTILQSLWRVDEARETAQKSATLNVASGSNYCYALNFDRRHSPADVFSAHRNWADKFMNRMAPPSGYRNERDPRRRLRVGYVSADFRGHSVAFFAAPLLARHDRGAVEVFCYANAEESDAVTERFRRFSDVWRDVRDMKDEAMAALVASDAIDILVDLGGHTRDHRLAVFARRPAPVQISYLGYPNTTGMRAMDYRIVDAITDPPGLTDPHHSETLLRLPGGFLCFEPPDLAIDPAPPPALRIGVTTFGSTNNLTKVNADVLALWARVLRATPDARLLVKDRRIGLPAVRSQLHAELARHGVDPARLELRQYELDAATHLHAYDDIDVLLDPFPYNGTTTTCEALWMGVPVVTLTGDRHAARVGTDLLHRIGADDLVAGDEEAYVATCVALAADPERLTALRGGLRGRLLASPLCDGPRLAREMEAAYRQAWRQWCASQD